MSTLPPLIRVHLADGELKPGPVPPEPRRETLAQALLRQRARADGRGELTKSAVEAQLSEVLRPEPETRAWGKVETLESGLHVETQTPAVERRYDVPEADRKRRSEHFHAINARRRGRSAEQRAEVYRLALVRLETPNRDAEREWRLPDDLEELLSEVFMAWAKPEAELRKPSHRSIHDWLEGMIAMGDLKAPG